MTNDEINLRPYLAYLGKSWYRILILTAIFTVAALGLFYVLPPQYRAFTVIVTPIIPSANAEKVAAGDASPLTILQGLGESHPVYDAVSKATGVKSADLRSILRVRRDPEYGQVIISATTGKKDLSLKMVTVALQEVRRLTSSLALTIADQQTRNLASVLEVEEKSLQDLEKDFSDLQARLKTIPDNSSLPVNSAYQKRLQQLDLEIAATQKKLEAARDYVNKLTTSPVSTPVADPARESFRVKVTGLEYDLRIALTKFGDQAPEVEVLRRQIAVAKSEFAREMRNRRLAADLSLDPQIAELEAELAALETTRSAISDLSEKAPEEALQFVRMQRRVENQKIAVDVVRAQFNQARIQSDVYKMPWSVLQEPLTEPTPVNKKYSQIAIIAFSVGLILSIWIYLFLAGRQLRRAEHD
jgi:uncharacterized protein involved in exopolysaccharide biosynthesis